MAAALPFVAAAGTALSVAGQGAEGISQRRAAEAEARSLEVGANNRLASSQRAAREEDRQGRLASSRALAVAAASGGGASDPTVMNLMAQLAGETNYRKMVSLYEGEEEARQMRMQASVTRAEGKAAETASSLKMLGTALAGGSSLYSKYWTKT